MGRVIGGGPGEPAGRLDRRFLPPEVIGPPDCPIMHRWTLIGKHTTGEATKVSGRPFGGRRRLGLKLLVHHFLPNADDRAEHDHPSSFLTIVLRGYYDDESPAGIERMRVGKVRYRPAEHRHRTQVGPKGCWTLVIMGPKRRAWGFWREGRWYPWKLHERLFGYGMRCPSEEES